MRRFVLCIALVVASLTASALDFKRYYGRDAVIEGKGGEMEQIEGVDYWTNGDPPRRYEIIGYIEDRRHASGLVGMARLKSLPKQVARMAKENGGDAVIMVSSRDDVIGYASNGSATVNGNNAYGSAMVAPVAKRESRFAVVRYIQESAQPPSNTINEGATTPAAPVKP